ncbi:MarR family winged helix-turn-helix transcriptional regulator [Nocardioides sp. W7]|uniref:MarR family winged helix-turn-helix transcriptional regulator n=1 Tax=Nocardioides sp. W7 TaxID=2931390 RepID=UPI001FD30C4E|nr:MarR family winged helix-turn-helix transcriptional regulator [Nocardioides sp. W7]
MLDYLARMGRRAAEALPDTLRPRHVIALEVISEQGPLGQRGLAEALRLDPSNVVGLLNELEEHELVTRRRDPADRRRHIVEISSKGTRELTEATTRFGHIEDQLFSTLSPQERRTLHTLLSRAVGAVSREHRDT